MRFDTLLGYAYSNMNSAKGLLRLAGDDEAYLNDAGYLAQQAVEKCLKHAIETSGVNFPFGHDITKLLKYILQYDVSSLCDETLMLVRENAELITSLEAKTRYTRGYLAARYAVENVLKIAETLFNELSRTAPIPPEDLLPIKPDVSNERLRRFKLE